MSENNLDPEEIRRLNEAFQELANTTAGLSGSMTSVSKAAGAMSSLTSSLNALAAQAKKEHTQTVKSTEAGKGSAASGMKLAKAFDNIATTTGNLNTKFKTFGVTIKNLSEAVDKFSGKTSKNATTTEKITKDLAKMAKAASSGTQSRGSSSNTFKQPKYKISDTTGGVSELSREQVAAYGAMGYSIVKLDKAVNGATHELVSATEAQKRYDKELTDLTGKTKAQRDATRLFEDSIKSLGYEIDSTGKIIKVTNELQLAQQSILVRLKHEQEEHRKKTEAINKLLGMWHDKIGTLVKAFDKLAETLGSTLLKLEGGMEKYGAALKKAGSSVQDFAGQFGPIGKVLGFLLGNLIKLAGVALEMSANLVKAQDELAKFGGSIGLSTDEFYNLGRRVGYSSENLVEFAKKLSKVGPALASLGNGSVSDGIKKFAAIGQVTEDQRESFRRLGLTQEDLVEAQADYINLQTSYGSRMNKSVALLQRESLAYAENLTALSALTGESKEELKKKQEAAASDLRFQLKIQQLQEGSQSDRDLAAKMEKNNAEVQARLGEKAAKAYREVATQGFTNSEEGLGMIRATNGAVVQLYKDMDSGKVSVEEGAKRIAEMRDVTNKTLGSALMLGKNAETFGNDIESQRKRQIALSGKSLEQIKKEIDEKKKAGDLSYDTEAKRQSAEINARQAMDSMAMVIQDKVLKVMKQFATVMGALAKGIAKFATWLGAPDFTYLFDSAEEIKARIDETASKIEQNQQKIDRAGQYIGMLDKADQEKDPNEKKKIYKALRQQGAGFFEDAAKKQMEEARVKELESLELKKKFLEVKKSGANPEQAAEFQTKFEKAEADAKAMRLQAIEATEFAIQFKRDLQSGVASIDDKTLRQRIAAIKQSSEALNQVLKTANDANKKQYLQKQEAIDQDDERIKRFSDLQQAEKKRYTEQKTLLLQQAGLKSDLDLDEQAADTAEMKERKKQLRERLIGMKKETDQVIESLEDRKKKVQAALLKEQADNREKYAGDVTKSDSRLGRLSQAIGGAEAGGSYDVAFGDRTDKNGNISNKINLPTAEQFGGKKLSDMTLAEVQQFQAARDAKNKGSGAAGKYQFMPSTLFGSDRKSGLVKQLGLSMDTKFDKNTQDRLQEALVTQNMKQLSSSGVPTTDANVYMAHYIGAEGAKKVHDAIKAGENITVADALTRGAKDPKAAKDALTKNNEELGRIRVTEFEGVLADRLKKRMESGASKPGRDSTGQVKPEDAKPTKGVIGQGKTGGIFTGPDSGYPVMMHGNEAIIPMSSSNVTKQTLDMTTVLKSLMKDMTPTQSLSSPTVEKQVVVDNGLTTELVHMLADKLDTAIEKLTVGNAIQDKLLKYSRA